MLAPNFILFRMILAIVGLLHFHIVGAQGRLPPNTPQWRADYFELKLLRKEPVQGHSDASHLPESRKQITLPVLRRKKASLSPEIGTLKLRKL